MDHTQITNLLNTLKTTNEKAKFLSGLRKFRTEVVINNEGIKAFRECKGIPIMIRFLGKPKEEVLEIALSILANCCSDKLCAEEALEHRITVHIVCILKSIPNPVIQCRACRLLGNLAKNNKTQLLESNCAVIAKSLCQIIEDTSDVGTRVMAIRAARYLASDSQFLQNFLYSNGFIIILQLLTSIMRKTITQEKEDDEEKITEKIQLSRGLKRNQHREKYFEEVARSLESVRSDIFDREVLKHTEQQQNLYEMPTEKPAQDLSFEIIKLFSIMSEKEMSLPVWNALTQKGCNLSVITFFANEQSKDRSLALRILANFSKSPGACYILSNSDVVTLACDLLLAADIEKALTEPEVRYCLNVLGHLSVDACNRSKIRRSGAIRKLIIMLRESKSQIEIAYILQLLNNFQYDNMSMDVMLKEGLVLVLIRELSDYLTSDNEYYKKRREERQERTKKRKMKIELVEQPTCKIKKISDDHVNEFDSPSCSPKSTTFFPSSPCSSRSMSPLHKTEGSENENVKDDETYSPICTDEEDSNSDNEFDTKNNDATDIMKLLDAISTRSAENTDEDKDEDDNSPDSLPLKNFGNMPRSTIDIIENLILRITLLVNKRAELGKAETISTLIKAINVFGSNNNFVGALTNILLESQFFAQTVKHGIAHQIYQLTKKDELRSDGFSFLETLTCVGESNYGKAELARLLRSDDIPSQKRAAITVAYIIKNRKMLLQFLCDGNALNIILDIILNGEIEDQLTGEAADALTSLSRYTLNISVPSHDPDDESFFDPIDEDKELRENLAKLKLGTDMRFILNETDKSDPIIIKFNKKILCDSSEVFYTMFHSSFREGNENEVRLTDYTASGLKYFLNLIMEGAVTKNTTFKYPSSGKHYALLEAYEMSRMYNLPPIEQAGLVMLKDCLDEKNCLQVLEWAMKNNHPELIEHAINYYLCSTISVKDKINLFRITKASNCATEWFEMLTDAVLCRCQSAQF